MKLFGGFLDSATCHKSYNSEVMLSHSPLHLGSEASCHMSQKWTHPHTHVFHIRNPSIDKRTTILKMPPRFQAGYVHFAIRRSGNFLRQKTRSISLSCRIVLSDVLNKMQNTAEYNRYQPTASGWLSCLAIFIEDRFHSVSVLPLTVVEQSDISEVWRCQAGCLIMSQIWIHSAAVPGL